MVTLQRAKKVGRKFQAPVETRVGGFRTMLKVLPQFFFNRKEREPKQPLGPFLTDVSLYERAPESGLRVTWFGHSSLLVEMDGVRVLLDPVWDERASPFSFLGPKRFFRPTMRLEEMPKVDAVLLSHDHYDHLGEKTVRALARLQPETRWVAPLGVGAIIQSFGVALERITEVDWTQRVEIGAMTVTAVPARHFSGRSLRNRNETLWTAFVLRTEQHQVYCGADTGLWPGFAAIAKEFGGFDLTMLEIGAFNEGWRDIHMGPDGAVEAFEALGGGVLMPIHWGLFDLALHGWREPIERVAELARAKGLRVFSPLPGLPTEVGDVWSEWWRTDREEGSGKRE
jgi:L-ascorbate metabolism protein UlaG (beta-lactamase superfamily)